MKKILSYFLFTLFVSDIFYFGNTRDLFAFIYYKYEFENRALEYKKKSQDFYKNNYSSFKNDIDFLNKSELLIQKTCDRDAANLLNDMFTWNSSDEPSSALIELSAKTLKALDDKKWYLISKELKRHDLSFFSKLQNYDCWSIYKSRHFQSYLKNIPNKSALEIPYIDSHEVLNIIKLRLLYGKMDKKLNKAINEINSFRNLLLTTQDSFLFQTALYVESIINKIKDGKESESNLSKVFHRLQQSFTNILNPFSDKDLVSKAFNENLTFSGKCILMKQAIDQVTLFKGYLKKFNPDYYDEIIQKVKSNSESCQFTHYKKFFKDKNFWGSAIPSEVVDKILIKESFFLSDYPFKIIYTIAFGNHTYSFKQYKKDK